MSYDDDVQQNPWTRPGFIAAALVVAIVLVLGTFLAFRAAGNDDPEPAPPNAIEPTASVEPEPEPTLATTDPSVCGLESVELDGTVTQAPEAEWSLVGTTAAPATDAGPGVVEATGFRYCFEQTPEGALLAAANIVAMGADSTLADDMTDRLIAEGPGRDAALAQLSAGGGGSTRVQISGFNLLSYSGDEATVDIAVRTSTGAVGAIAYALVWEAGDWKVRLRDDGTLLNPPVQLPDLTGYIPWAGA